tara:strand:- start:229 stop:666 length:438 start_codon:yes stop_codon:yes gene_type:complete
VESENSIGTVVDRITCSYVRYAVVTNLRTAMAEADKAGLPPGWGFHVDLLEGRILWTNDDVPCTVCITPGKSSAFDTDICVEVEVDSARGRDWSVQDIEKLQSLIECQNLDDGLVIAVDWTGDPDYDALQYLMLVAPILKALEED